MVQRTGSNQINQKQIEPHRRPPIADLSSRNPPASIMSRDSAVVIAWPPLVFAACAGIGIIAHFIHAVPIESGGLIRWLGGLVTVCSGALALWAERVMKSAGTNVRPDKPTLVIVRRGPYRFTRNP